MNDFEIQDQIKQELLAYMNETPNLVSLLYDLGFMPEQLKEGSRDYLRCFQIIAAWKTNDPQETANET